MNPSSVDYSQKASFYVPWEDNNFFSCELETFQSNLNTRLQKLAFLSEEVQESPALHITKPPLQRCEDRVTLYKATMEKVKENVLKWTSEAESMDIEKRNIEKQLLSMRSKKSSLQRQIAELEKKLAESKESYKVKKPILKLAEKIYHESFGIEAKVDSTSSHLYPVTLMLDINGKKHEVKFIHDVNLNRISDLKLGKTFSFTKEEEEMLNQHVRKGNDIDNAAFIGLMRKLLIEKDK